MADVPGTTRDALEATIEVENYPLRLIDTAGLHDASDVVERLGIALAERHLARAGVVLMCGDQLSRFGGILDRIRRLTAAPVIAVRTKSDIEEQPADAGALDSEMTRAGVTLVRTSVRTGVGLSRLSAALIEVLGRQFFPVDGATPLLTRERHVAAISAARHELQAFHRARLERVPMAVAAVHLHSAAAALEELIGIVTTEDVLGRVFGAFCIGK